jgi:CHAT domain-containing protein/tetratricopeptide (TPR) repeat protein
MVESQAIAKQAHEKLEDQLTCAICLDAFKDPKLLQCFHVYCKDCLKQLAVTDKQGQVSLLCPTCREVTLLPPATRDPIDMLPRHVPTNHSVKAGDTSSNNSSVTEHVLSQPFKFPKYGRCDSVILFTKSVECNTDATSSTPSPYPTNLNHPLHKEYAYKTSGATPIVIPLTTSKPVARCQSQQPVQENCFLLDRDFQGLKRNENESFVAQDGPEFTGTKRRKPTSSIWVPPPCSEKTLKLKVDEALIIEQNQIETSLPNSKVVPHHQSQSQQEKTLKLKVDEALIIEQNQIETSLPNSKVVPHHQSQSQQETTPSHREYSKESRVCQSKPEKEVDIVFTSTQVQFEPLDGVSNFQQPGDSESIPVDPLPSQSMWVTDSDDENKPLHFPDKPCDEPAEFSADKANQTQATQLQTKGTKSTRHRLQPVTHFASPHSKKSKARRAEKEAEQMSSTLNRRRKTAVSKPVTGALHVLSFLQLMGVDSDSTSALSANSSTSEAGLQVSGSTKLGSIESLKHRSSSNSSNVALSKRDPVDGDSIRLIFKGEVCEERCDELIIPLSLFRPDGSIIQEETDHGYHTEICFSRVASLPKLLKNKKSAPVFCLPRRSAQWKSFDLEKTETTTGSVGTSQFREGGHPTPLAPGPPEAEPPEINFDEITKSLRIPDYPMIIHLTRALLRSQHLSPKSAISVHFITGVAYFKLSKYDEATEEFQESQKLAKNMKRDGDVMLCCAYLGDIQYASQEYLKAAEHYKTAIKHYELTSVAFYFKLTPPTLSAIHAKRASSFRNVSRMLEAVQDYRIAINVARTDRDRLSAHTSLGNLYQSMGENNKALEEYKESIKLATLLSDHVSLGWAHGNIGNAYLGLNRKDEALFNLHKSLDLATEYERTPQAIGRTYNNLGTAYQSINDLDKAEEYYDLALSQAVYGNDNAGQARVYGNIGNVHMLRKNYERAIPHYGEVLQLSKDAATISTARHNRGCAYYEWATSLLGKVPMQVHFHGPKCDVDTCLDHLPARAKELYRKGSEDLEEVMKYHEEKFQHIKGSAQGLTLSVSLFESNSRTFHRLQDCLVNLHKFDRALEVAEKSRARTLGELMLKRKRKDLQRPLNSPLNFEQIASIVKRQRSPLVYLSYTGARLIGWVFTLCSDEVSMNAFEIPFADDQFDDKSFDYYLRYTLTEKLVERSFEMYQTIVYDETSSSPVQKLFELLAAPVQKLLASNGSNQQVIFISDSYTSLLPLTCLHDRNSGSFFGDKHCFKLAPSLLSLGIMNQLPEVTVTLPPDQQDVCVIGDPNIPPFTLNGEVWTLGKLPHARREAEWVAFALQTTPILNENATLTSFLTRSMSAKVIHIATHGSASFGFLAFATFATSAKSGSRVYVPAENVLLYPDKVEQLHISPALVVLSSCDSARGTVKADGIQGMARAFILAGAQSVLTTLWKVPDESASVFMQFFYQYLLDGLKSSFALQKATLSVRCFAKYSQYIHWSGYQLTGRDIHFLTATTAVAKILRSRLGTPSVFPHLQSMKMLETVLVKNTSVPTDIQVWILNTQYV